MDIKGTDKPEPIGRHSKKCQQNTVQTAMLSRRATVARLYTQGVTQMKIADYLGVSQSVISADLKIIRQEWLENIRRDYGELVAEELAKINRVEAEAWDQLEASKRVAIRTITKTEGDKETITTHEEEELGDPRFMNIILGCIDKRCKLLGLDGPPQTVLPVSEDEIMTTQQASQCIQKTIEELQRITAIEEADYADKDLSLSDDS